MQGNKTLLALIAVVVVAAGAYYMLAGTVEAPTAPMAENSDALPAATDSVDDFAASLEADVSATAAALSALDADVSASAAELEAASDVTNLYDPESI